MATLSKHVGAKYLKNAYIMELCFWWCD